MVYTKIKSFDENGQEIEEYVYFMPKGNGGLGCTFIIGEGDRSKNQYHFGRIIDRARTYFGV